MKGSFKALVLGMVALTPTSAVRAGFYIGGQLGMTGLSTKRTKTLKVPSSRPALKNTLPGVVVSMSGLRGEVYGVCTKLGLTEGQDVTFHHGDSAMPCGFGVLPSQVHLAEAVSSPQREKEIRCVAALVSLKSAGDTFKGFMNDWFRVVNQSLRGFGFNEIKPYSEEDVLIPNTHYGPGNTWFVRLPARFLTHPGLPDFCVSVIAPVGEKKGSLLTESDPRDLRKDIGLQFRYDAFTDLLTLQETCRLGLLWNVPQNLEQAMVTERNRLLTRVEEGCRSIHGVAMEETSRHLSVSFVGGWDGAFFSSKGATFGRYIGFEAFNRFSFGKTMLPNPPAGDSVVQSQTSLKTRYTFGFSALPGVTSKNGWVFYVPLTIKVTRHSLGLKKAVARDNDCEFLRACGDADFSTKAEGVWSDCVAKWKFGGEIGIGSRVQVSPNVSVGVRYVHASKDRISVDTLAYASTSYRDIERFGTHQDIEIGEQGVALEFLYHF